MCYLAWLKLQRSALVLVLLFTLPSVGNPQSTGYTLPVKAVKLDAKGVEAILSAKTVVVTAIEHAPVDITSVDPNKRTATVVVHGGIRRGVDAEKAKKSVQEVIQEWARFTLIDNPAEADLVVVIFEDSVPPSGFSKMGGDEKYRLRDTLGVFLGGQPETVAQPLWVDISTESTLGALTGSSAAKVAKKFRSDVENLSKQSKK